MTIQTRIESFTVWVYSATFAAPLIYLVACGFLGSFSPGNWRSPSFDGLLVLVKDEEVFSAFCQSLSIAVVSSTAAVILALALILGSKFERTAIAYDSWYIALSVPDMIWALGFLLLFKEHLLAPGLGMVLLVHVTFNLILSIVVLSPTIREFPNDIIDAALDLGASPMTTAFTIILPRIRTGLLAALALSFLYSFDDFVLTFMVRGTDVTTLPLLIYSRIKYGAGDEVLGVASLSIMLAILIILTVHSLAKHRYESLFRGEV